ncbi:quinon protein alcohol dehydrogenase-like superfamily [Vararia minispora EC-137]|uniref:Quinon protein alcohol dehydrogenase-like superfamily n=1 Tax=Vararia minispora EC-137 TaxID=1314806 RepID=A0ACB8Q4C5_9AGAM|nr:quinon protein alcohol dehydrogenase-like superfamily [Vararia minispora EC-137]
MTALDTTKSVVDQLNGVDVQAFTPLIKNLEVFASLVNTAGEIHPYAKMAFIIFSSLADTVLAQASRDSALKGLLDTIMKVYAFVNRYQDVSKLGDDRRRLLKVLSLQTVECAYFIRDQARVRSFVKHTTKNVFYGSQIDGQISDYKDTFLNVRRQLTGRGVLEVEVRVCDNLSGPKCQLRCSNYEGDIPEYHNLAHVRGAGLDSAKECLPGTRHRILDDLSTWVNDPDGARVRLLVGFAGNGKSAIAHSLGLRFHALRRLGCFFAFDRNFQGDRHPESVLSTIAHELASWNASFKHALAAVLCDNGTLAHTVDITAQWNGLIVEPAKRVQFFGPILIIVDAFDESGPVDLISRSLLLKHLLHNVHSLPPNFRILLTSRPEGDVRRALGDKFCAIDALILSPDDVDVEADIDAYVHHWLRPQYAGEQALSESQLSQIVQKAGGLFQWAATACRVILQDPRGLSLRECFEERIDRVLQSGSSLDDLYASILNDIFSNNPTVMSRFQSVMAQILCTSEPLPATTLQSIRSYASVGEKDDVMLVVCRMGALLSGVSGPTTPIRPLHTSFRDFLTTPSRSGIWHVIPEDGDSITLLGLVRALNKGLRFNICNIETSYLRNSQIPNLQQRIHSSVPSSILLYAGTYLNDHMRSQSSGFADPLPPLRELLCDKLLLWLELLSVLNTVRTAPSILRSALSFFLDTGHNETTTAIQDAIRFVHRFAYPISQSAPHIYISALPFAPTESITRSYFTTRFSRTPKISGSSRNWSRVQAVISTLTVGAPFRGHLVSVRAVAYSHDGRRIVSGAEDGAICIWDVYTGEAICEPICSHSDHIHSVSFSPDDQHILSASHDKTLRLWNTETGQAVGEPFHCSSPIWAAVYSPDGTRITSGCTDGTVHIWDVGTRKSIGEPLHVHSAGIASVSYSSNGSLIASGSHDNTIRIWNAHTGEAVGGPLHGHSASVRSVAFSPDSHYIVSGSYDSTVRIWKVETGEQIEEVADDLQESRTAVWSVACPPGGSYIVSGHSDGAACLWNLKSGGAVGYPLLGHSSGVQMVALSPNGHRIATGSSDGMVRIWSTVTREAMDKPPNGHSDMVLSLAYSPDGRQIASASADKTIRIWNAQTGQCIGEPLHGHSDWVVSVAYSPDSQHIVSGSRDSTIRIWDANSCKSVGDPFQGHIAAVRSVAYSPDGSHIASGSWDATVWIWDVRAGKAVSEHFCGHPGAVLSVAYSPNGRCIVSASYDMTVRIWDTDTGDAVGEPFHGHFGAVYSAVYSSNGKFIISGGEDGPVRIWDADQWKDSDEVITGHQGRQE